MQNLTLDSPAVSSTNNYGYAGAVAGHNNGGAIENCHVTGGSISGNIAGGVVGINERDGSVIGCSSSAKVNGTGGYTYAGGVVGTNSGGGTVTGCSSTGTVTGNNAGGVVGLNSGTVTACYHANGQVEGYTNAGGVVGFNVYKVTACYWSGNQTQGIGDGTQAADPEYSPSGNNGEIPPKNKVPDGTTWEAAVEAMNAQGTGYTFGGDMNNPTLTKK